MGFSSGLHISPLKEEPSERYEVFEFSTFRRRSVIPLIVLSPLRQRYHDLLYVELYHVLSIPTAARSCELGTFSEVRAHPPLFLQF